MAQEKKFWDKKIRLLENAENIRYVLSNKKGKNVSFYESFAVLLSSGYLDPDLGHGENIKYIN